jgi:hypothetical protein
MKLNECTAMNEQFMNSEGGKTVKEATMATMMF